MSLNASLKQRVSSRFWLPIALAFMLALPFVFASTPALAGGEGEGDELATASGKFCIEGSIIDHAEEPVAGITVTATPDDGSETLTAVSAEDPDDKDADLQEGDFEFEDLMPINYTLAITVPAGFEAVTPASFDVPLNEKVGSDSCVTVRFKIRELITVYVHKVDQDLFPLEDWIITASPGKGNFFAEEVEEETDANGVATFSLSPGKWVFSEMPPKTEKGEKPVSFMPFVPQSGKQELKVESGVASYNIRFKNQIKGKGCLVVDKYEPTKDSGPIGLVDWRIEVQRIDGSIAAVGHTDALGRVRFDHLAPGPYRVLEESRVGWEHATPPVIDVVVSGGRDVDTGDTPCAHVTFHNNQSPNGFCVEGRKLDKNGDVGLPGWEFDAKLVAGGDNDDLKQTVATNGLGEFVIQFPIDDYRIPGGTVKICEDVQDGWESHSPSCRIAHLPKHPDVCVDIGDFVNAQVGHDKAQMHKMIDYDDCDKMHKVKEGDQLYALARHYGVTPQAMVDANPKVRKNNPHLHIYPGDKLCVPEKPDTSMDNMPEYGPPMKAHPGKAEGKPSMPKGKPGKKKM